MLRRPHGRFAIGIDNVSVRQVSRLALRLAEAYSWNEGVPVGFELEESAVAQTEKVLQETGDRVREEARRVMDEVAGLSGSGWQGAP